VRLKPVNEFLKSGAVRGARCKFDCILTRFGRHFKNFVGVV
jgi:hypothetical protein